MPMNRFKLGSVSLLLMTACTGFPFFWRQSPSPDTGATQEAGSTGTQVPPHVILAVQDVHYDGLSLSGRILVSPEGDPLRLDKRLLPTRHVNVERVSNCVEGQPVTTIRADAIAPLAGPEHLLLLSPGYWYGTTVRFRLFSEHFTGLGPECIEADLSLLSFDGEPIARQHIRAQRSLPQTVDGGLPEEPPPPGDAGSP